MCRYLVYNLMNEIHYNWILNFHRLRIWLQSNWHWRRALMDTHFTYCKQAKWKAECWKEFTWHQDQDQNQRLVAYLVMIYRWSLQRYLHHFLNMYRINDTLNCNIFIVHLKSYIFFINAIAKQWNDYTSISFLRTFFSLILVYRIYMYTILSQN